MIKLCFVTAIPMTVEAFLVDYIRSLSADYHITVVTNAEDAGFLSHYQIDCRVVSVPIERDVSLLKDIKALFKLYTIFRTERFASVHSVTPKAGLLAMVAALFAGIPIRIHTFTGQVWVTKKGIKRWFLKTMDRVIVLCATHILVDSTSQRDFLLKEGLIRLIR